MPDQGWKNKLQQLTQIGIALSKERDHRRLLDMILEKACEFTTAEAGTLYTIDSQRLLFQVAHNEALGVEQELVDAPPMPLTPTSLAGYCALTGELVNIPDAYELPDDVPYSFNKSYDEAYDYRTRSVLMVPMKAPTGDMIGVLQLINARSEAGVVEPFEPDDEPLVASLASQAAVSISNVRLNQQLEQTYLEIIFRLARAAEFRDSDTGEHIQRMSLYSEVLARRLGMGAEEAEQLRYAAAMHDIGKIGVSDAILLKPGRYTDAEFDEMKKHTVFGGKILEESKVPLLQLSQVIALTHHERWDGTGYPEGLKGEEIPLSGRIVALADVFDALRSKRCYKEAFPLEKTLEIIRESSGSQFDPRVVEAFFDVLPELEAIYQRFSDGREE